MFDVLSEGNTEGRISNQVCFKVFPCKMNLSRGSKCVQAHLFLPPSVSLSCLSTQESDYFTPQGEFRVDKAGSPTLLNCLMYKMSYYRFGEMQVCPH